MSEEVEAKDRTITITLTLPEAMFVSSCIGLGGATKTRDVEVLLIAKSLVASWGDVLTKNGFDALSKRLLQMLHETWPTDDEPETESTPEPSITLPAYKGEIPKDVS